MPPPPTPYTPVPYVRDMDVPDTIPLMRLMQMAAEQKQRALLQQGQSKAEGRMQLGALIANALGGFRQEREERSLMDQQRAYAEQKLMQDEQFRRDQLASVNEEREANRALREDAQRRQEALDAERRGALVAEEVGFGPMNESQLTDVLRSPAAGRARYHFGPGTAEGPELLPTKEQAELEAFKQDIAARGGTVGPTGQAVLPPREPVEPNPTEASLALLAAQGNQGAIRALEIIRQQRPPQAPPAEPALVPIVGPDGKTRYGTRQDARGTLVPSGSEKPSSGVQKRVLNFFNRAEQADRDLEALEPEIQQMGAMAQGRMAWAPNLAQTPTGRQYTAAQRAFTEARLRKDSGASIPPHEFESDRQTYFVQPGDDPETLANKRRARAAMLASLAFESGQALGEFLGDADEATAVIQSYKDRSAKPLKTTDVPKAGPLKPGQTVTIGKYQVRVNR